MKASTPNVKVVRSMPKKRARKERKRINPIKPENVSRREKRRPAVGAGRWGMCRRVPQAHSRITTTIAAPTDNAKGPYASGSSSSRSLREKNSGGAATRMDIAPRNPKNVL